MRNTKYEEFQSELIAIEEKIKKIEDQNNKDKWYLIYEHTLSIIDKQYRSYTWNDSKVQSLITIDAALFAGTLVIRQIFGNMNVIATTFLICAMAAQIVSLIVSLIHIIPKINSKIGNELNLRTIVGISPYTKTQTKDDYLTKMCEADIHEMIKQNCYQIVGMCKNNLRSETFIRAAVILTIIGIVFFSLMILFVFFNPII